MIFSKEMYRFFIKSPGFYVKFTDNNMLEVRDNRMTIKLKVVGNRVCTLTNLFTGAPNRIAATNHKTIYY